MPTDKKQKPFYQIQTVGMPRGKKTQQPERKWQSEQRKREAESERDRERGSGAMATQPVAFAEDVWGVYYKLSISSENISN